MSDRKALTVRMDEGIYNNLARMAKDNKRSIAKELEYAVSRYLDEYFEKESIFGQRLKGLREHEEKSRAELGEKLGIPESDISKYERGVLEPDQETLIRIASYFLETTDYLLGISDEKGLSLPGADVLMKIFPEWSEKISNVKDWTHTDLIQFILDINAQKDRLYKGIYGPDDKDKE